MTATAQDTLTAAIERAKTIDGWMEPDELRWLGQRAAEMQSIVEIGCWKGRSTSVLLAMCPGIVTAVDHWQGGADEPEFIRERAREENICAQFLANVGNAPNLLICPQPSASAAMYVNHADMVFIDGGHGYEEVRADIRAWLPKTRKLICGHDYYHPPVRNAVRDELGDVPFAAGSIWAKYL